MIEFKVEHYQELSSTNTFLKEQLRNNNIPEGTVILADYQQQGKGRADSGWHANGGENLLASILFRPGIQSQHHFTITEFISLAIIDTMKCYGVEAKIKWPNDIYVGNRKLAGILIENSLMGNCIHSSVVGLGININQLVFPEDIPNPVSLHNLIEKKTPIDKVVKVLFEKCDLYYNMVTREKFKLLHEKYNRHLYMINEEMVYMANNKQLCGKLLGVEQTGELVIQNGRGTRLKYLFGEAKMIID